MSLDIQKVKRTVFIRYSFLESKVGNIPLIENRNIKTACTNNKVVYYNPNYMEKLSFMLQVSLLSHEYFHILNDHIKRGRNKVHRVWNIATDAFINANLKKDGLPLGKGWIDKDEALDYDSESYYEKLMTEKENNKQDESKNDNSNDDSSQNNDEFYDPEEAHEEWYKPLEDDLNDDYDNNEENNKQGSNEKIKDNSEEAKKEYNEREMFEENRKNIKQKLEELKKDYLKDKENEFNIQELGDRKALLDWKKRLLQNSKKDYDWTYQNAEIHEGIVRPHLEEQTFITTEILLDTSLSISDELLRNFLMECKNILKVSELKVGCFDTKFYGFNRVRNKYDINNMQFKGRGGTDFNVAVNAFSKNADNKIIFTDGYAPMPDKAIDAIWIVFGNRKINPKGGKVIYINEDDLNRVSIMDDDVKKIR
ncbi:MAG: hypothetical protein J6J17_05730 [Bacilli bacterium]|nr:hypothetical protein [Bacilli bacterium]